MRGGFSTRCRALGSSVNKGEEEFCELRLYGVLRSSAVRDHAAQSLQSRKEVADLLGVVDAEPVVE